MYKKNKNVIRVKPKKNIFSPLGINNIDISEVAIFNFEKKIEISCAITSTSHLEELDHLQEIIHNKFGRESECSFDIKFLDDNIKVEELRDIIERVITDVKKKHALSRSFLYLYRINIQQGYIDIELKNQIAVDTLLDSDVHHKLNYGLSRFGIDNFEIKLVTGDFSKELKEIDDSVLEIRKTLEKEHDVIREAIKEKPKEVKTSKSGNVIHGREIKGKTIPYEAFAEAFDGENCVLEGEIFDIEERDIKSGESKLLTIRITNHIDSVNCKSFFDKGKVPSVKKGQWIKIGGKKQRDRYNNDEEVLMFSSINAIEGSNEEREDNASEKRIELHTHTKMSEMVGAVDAKELVNQAIKFGHKALAITDYGVAQAFPFAHSAAKGSDLKIIFGLDAYVVDDKRPLVENPKKTNLMEETYIVYDLETMGLNSHANEIIEIGAVKMKGTTIIEVFSTLVNPQKPIPQKIQDITGIKDDMVASAPSIETILPKFYEFIGEATLVAHNAKFDIGFIRRDLKKIMNIDFNPSVIDTLQWGRDLLPDLRGHGLKPLCKHLGISIENHHRALDDAQATARVFAHFLEVLEEKGGDCLSELDGLIPVNVARQIPYNTMILVENQVGLKNLYELISKAHINNYGQKKPRIKKSELEELREGLIVGSPASMYFGNEGELISEYLRYNIDSIEARLGFYDYIEVQPRDTYNELIEAGGTGSIEGYEDIETYNKFILELANKNNIPAIATANVHYLEKNEAIIRSILLYGSGSVFRESHYKSDNNLYFRTTDEMLDEFAYLGAEKAKELVITNPNSINDKIGELQPVPNGFYPPKIDNAEEIVREMTYKKAKAIYGPDLPEIVESRLKRELDAIIGNGFSVLYLSAQKLVKKSLDNGYLVGSRGSVGSSLVAFMMDITEVNALYPHYRCATKECFHSEFLDREGAGVDLPDKFCPKCSAKLIKDGYAIPFEVFMGFNGDKVPDIDLNFSGDYQSEIHRYCEELFGAENVFKAGTISTLAEKNAFGYVKKYFEEHDIFKREADILRLAKKVEGAKKTTGQHPGGMIVVPEGHSIYEFTPVQRPANDIKNPSTTTHFDYHIMDEQLVKLDILGHDDPTTIKLLEDYTGVNVADVPLADPKTLELFSKTTSLGVKASDIQSEVGTYGVPEFGTGFVRQMLMDTKPTTFAELVRISGLSHGTDVWLNNAQEFVRNNTATLSQVISVRDDIMNYLIDSGIEKGTAFKIMEFVRKGMPTRKPEEWEEYSKLMKEHKVEDWYIESCKRIKYMFPKGHAVAYVMMAMRIAYFKVHYPLAFYAAFLSRKADSFDSDFMLDLASVKEKLKELKGIGRQDARQKNIQALCEIILEMNARGYTFSGIDLYKSTGFKFTIDGDKISVPLVAVNGLGGSVVENIIRERDIDKFLSYEDFRRRTKASKTTVEKLKELDAITGLSDTNQRSLF